MIFIASDHAGLPLKEFLIKSFPELPWKDLGPFDGQSVDFPDYSDKVARELAKAPTATGVLLCGSGQGMAMRANKYSHVRAALCWDTVTAKLSREHNNANVLCIGSRLIPYTTAAEILSVFIKTPFAGGRHENRVKKIGAPLV